MSLKVGEAWPDSAVAGLWFCVEHVSDQESLRHWKMYFEGNELLSLATVNMHGLSEDDGQGAGLDERTKSYNWTRSGQYFEKDEYEEWGALARRSDRMEAVKRAVYALKPLELRVGDYIAYAATGNPSSSSSSSSGNSVESPLPKEDDMETQL